MATTKRISILRHDYKIVHTDVLRIDHEQLKNQGHLLDEMYRPACKEEEMIVHLVTGGEIYYDILIQNNNVVESIEADDEDQQWIRIFLSRGDLIVIPKGQMFRSTTTGTVSLGALYWRSYVYIFSGFCPGQALSSTPPKLNKLLIKLNKRIIIAVFNCVFASEETLAQLYKQNPLTFSTHMKHPYVLITYY
jgi:hypothetical protein